MKKFLNSLHTPLWLFITLLIVLLLRIPSFFEPYSYGDEMIYLILGEAMRRGIPLYSGIHDNKPPLLYMLAAVSGSLFWFKAILTIWILITVFLFWKLTVTLFPKNDRLQKVSTIIFALLTTLPLLEGNIANAELFMIGPTIIGFLILLTRENNFRNLFLAGISFSIAALFKIPAAFEVAVAVFYFIVKNNKMDREALKKIIVNTLYLSLGFIIPIGLTFIWYGLQGAFKQYLVAAFLQNVGYLSSFRPGDVQKPFIVRNAPLLFRAGIVFFGLVILFWKRKKLSLSFGFISAWLLITLFAVSLSERPYPHYLIQSIGPISLLMGMIFTRRNVEQVLAIIPLTLAFLVPVYYKFWYYPTTSYYTRFVKFASQKMTKEEYLLSFGGQVPRNYKIASYIAALTKPDEKVFVWGDSPPVYALARRLPPGKYVAYYHIKDFSSEKETVDTLVNKNPSFIVLLPDNPVPSQMTVFIKRNYGLVDTIEGAQIWKLLKPSLRDIKNSIPEI